MHQEDLRRADLNLLVALDALLEERNVTRAASRLGLSQPATSRALARLRALFGDDLLVDGAGGYLLSARAEELRPLLKTTLAGIGAMLRQDGFDPATAEGSVRLMTPDLMAAVLMPGLLQRIGQAAPRLTLDVLQPTAQLFQALADDHADAVIGLVDQAPAGIHRRNLFDQRMVTLMRRDHPDAGREMTLDLFLSMGHVAVSITGSGPAPIDLILQRMGQQRQVKARVPSFFTALEIAAQSDLIITLPDSLAETGMARARFVMRQPPLPLGSFSMSLVWHARHHASARHRWLRQTIAAAAEAIRSRPDPRGADRG